MHITSPANPRIKHLKKLLNNKKYRYEKQEYVFETNLQKKITELTDIVEIFSSDLAFASEKFSVTYVDPDIMNIIATTESPTKYMVILKLTIKTSLPTNGRFIYIDNIQDPGNLGSIIRSSVAFLYDGLIISPGSVDPFSPKTIRSSSGYSTRSSFYQINLDQLQSYNTLAADIGGDSLANYTPQKDFIVIFSNEGNGLSPEINKLNPKKIAIETTIDSLNVAVAAGIILHQLSL